MTIYNLRLSDLAAVKTAYELGSLSKAAEALFTTRQSIARSLENIEKAAGARLFDRSSAGIVPNARGREILASIISLLEEAEKLEARCQPSRESKPITLGVIGKYQTGSLIEAAVRRYSSEKGKPQVEVVQCEWPEIIRMVEKGEIDFAYVALVDEYIPDSLKRIEIKKDHFYLVLPKGKLPSTCSAYSASEINKLKIMLLSRYNIQLGMLDQYSGTYNLEPFDCYTTSDIFLLDEFVERDDYAVLLLDYAAENLLRIHPDYSMIPLQPPLMRRSGLICRKSLVLTEYHYEIINLLKKELGND